MATTDEFLEAVKAGDIAQVKVMAAIQPALTSARTSAGEPALTVALRAGHDAVVKFLLGRSAPLDIFSASALGRSSDVLNMLTADHDLAWRTNSDGMTALHLAAQYGHGEVIEMLVRGIADLHAKTRGSPKGTALHLAVAGGHLDAARRLIRLGAGVDARQEGGLTPLHIAAGRGDLAMARLLLRARAEVNAVDEAGRTPLALAIDHAHEVVAELLRSHGGIEKAGSEEAGAQEPEAVAPAAPAGEE